MAAPPAAPAGPGLRVVVVGAGFSGLAAARTLQDRAGGRVAVTVLEAGHRVGGRGCTVQARRLHRTCKVSHYTTVDEVGTLIFTDKAMHCDTLL